ncbi:hypothetical protein GCM10023205_36710 [Yinghuangia aomiensis]|uniref:Uncharacterized protein n=1 Tax=Yinghuangia aomiensis TaxID=676205 RepID=A0ABP9HDB2_9ACTN
MALFADDSEEAAAYHACRIAPIGTPIPVEQLARAGAYASSLAWSGHLARHGKPATMEKACHVVSDAADAFIDHTAQSHAMDADAVDAAKHQATDQYSAALRELYG